MTTGRFARGAAVAASVVLLGACAAPATEGADTLTGPATAHGAAAAEPARASTQPPAAAYGRFAALNGPIPTKGVIKADCVPKAVVRAVVPPLDPDPKIGNYELGAVGSFDGDPVTLFPGVSTSAITGTFCAKAVLEPPPSDGSHPDAHVCTHLIAPADGISFGDVTTTVNYIPTVTSVIAQVKVVPSALSAYVCDDGTPGQIQLDTVVEASAVPSLFGTSCAVGPLHPRVTGSFTGPLTDAVAKLTSETFDVSAVQATPATSDPKAAYCPAGLAATTNQILGLPRPSINGLTIRTTTALYLPPPGT